jgi:DnaJ domain
MVSSVTATPNHYEVLGLAPTATPDEIAKAYAAQMATFRLRPENALKRLASLSTAYETLRDPVKRGTYDQSLGLRDEPPVRQATSPFIAAAVTRPQARPHVGSFIAESLRPPVQKTEPKPPAFEAPERPARPVAEPLAYADEEPVSRTIDRNHATVAAGVVGLAALALAISLPARHGGPVAAAPTAAPQQAVTVGLPPATPGPDTLVAQAAPTKSQAAAPSEQPPVVAAVQPPEAAPIAAAAPDQQPPTETAATEAPAVATDQPAAAPTQDNAPAAAAADAAPAPATDSAKLPLANATIARTIERIGYACGSVASTAATGSGGVFRVTCSSGDSYQATPLHGRYHFRRLGSH